MGAIHQAVIGGLGGVSAPPPLLSADETFTTSTGWTLGPNAAISGGVLVLTGNGTSGDAMATAPTNCVPGVVYTIGITKVVSVSGAPSAKIELTNGTDEASVNVGGSVLGAVSGTIDTTGWVAGAITLRVRTTHPDFEYSYDDVVLEVAS